jgi:integrase
VGKNKTEAGTGRVIPLNAFAAKVLADWGEKFPSHQPGDEVFPLGWRKAWHNALKSAGLKLRFHDLRHTAITKLAEGQVSDQTIMSIADHVSRAKLEHYSHIRLAAKHAALDSISTPSAEPLALQKQSDFLTGVDQHGNQLESGQKEASSNLLN